MIYLISFILLSYLIGSIPTSVWIGKFFYGKDVREYGSGNAGATNTFRVLGAKAGIPVFIIDAVKGWIPAFFAQQFYYLLPYTTDELLYPIIIGIIAVIGHIFPVFAQFRGGKGVATILGVAVAIEPLGASICAGIFLIFLLLTKYVSLGSLIAGICFPLLLNLIIGTQSTTLVIFSILATVVLFVTHKKNLRRLFAGTESKTYIIKKKQF
jgi:glycerol-3-phosphate acyltransferase PlsY